MPSFSYIYGMVDISAWHKHTFLPIFLHAMLGIWKNIRTFARVKHFAPRSVKHILRFLFTIVMAIAFINGASGSDSTRQESQDFEECIDMAYLSVDTTDFVPELYALRQTPASNNGIRSQRPGKKKSSTYSYRTFFISGDGFHTPRVRYFVHNSNTTLPPPVGWPSDMLIRLGRLII